MLCLARALFRKAWGLLSLLTLVPLAAKGMDYDAGDVHATRWSWAQTALPPLTILFMEAGWHCRRRICASATKTPAAPTPAHRTARIRL